VHNVGLAHAARVKCGSDGKCDRDKYGDNTDPMGSGGSDTGFVCLTAAQVRVPGVVKPYTRPQCNGFETRRRAARTRAHPHAPARALLDLRLDPLVSGAACPLWLPWR
jgi:hypothetical protein